MRKLTPLVSVLICMLLFSCKNDDNNDTNENPLRGAWRLVKVTPQGNGNTLDCASIVTTLEFFAEQNGVFRVAISSLNADVSGSVEICVSNDDGSYDLTDDVTFDSNFIPPPKNSYTYQKEGDTLKLTTKQNNIVYKYVEN